MIFLKSLIQNKMYFNKVCVLLVFCHLKRILNKYELYSNITLSKLLILDVLPFWPQMLLKRPKKSALN